LGDFVAGRQEKGFTDIVETRLKVLNAIDRETEAWQNVWLSFTAAPFAFIIDI